MKETLDAAALEFVNCRQTGVVLAEPLGITHAALVSRVEIQDEKVKVHRELEGGL